MDVCCCATKNAAWGKEPMCSGTADISRSGSVFNRSLKLVPVVHHKQWTSAFSSELPTYYTYTSALILSAHEHLQTLMGEI